MDKRFEQIIADYENNALALDDIFKFKCRRCGKCCKNREDILLTARDLHNIAKDLGRTIPEVVDRYCEVYVGHSSKMPIIRLRPTGPEKACPLLFGKRCIVHKAKPFVCALFPLGRAFTGPIDDLDTVNTKEIKPEYFMQSEVCGSTDHEQTVRSWLEAFGIPAEDEFYSLWTRAAMTAAAFFHCAEDNGAPDAIMEALRNLACNELYLDYDPHEDLIPQFQANSDKLAEVMTSLKISIGGSDGE